MAAFLAGLAIRYALAKEKMKKLGAISEKTAMKPEELAIEEWVLKRLTQGRGVEQTKDRRYYLPCKDKKHC